MKISKLVLSLMISGTSLGTAAAQEPISLLQLPATDANELSTPPNSRKHIGDSAVVPAAPEFGTEVGTGSRKVHLGDFQVAPAAASFSKESFASCDLSAANPCDVSSGVTCDTGGCAPSCGSGACGTAASAWLDTEALLWWGQARNAPPILATSVSPALPVPALGATVVVGGENGISQGMMPGYRVSGGFYLDSCKKIGIGARAFGLFRDSDTTTRASADGSTAIGLPFFSTLQGVNNAFLVSYNNGVNPLPGSASVTTKLDLFAVEPSMRFLLGRSNDHKVEFLAGYTYLKMNDSIGLNATYDDAIPNATPDGRYVLSDLFATKNDFHGGHIGIESSIRRRRVSLTTLAKVALGNFSQTRTISGSYTYGPPPGFVAGAPQPGGFYALPSNIGTVNRDKFGFIPEFGVKGGLCVRQNVELTCGYSFVYLSNVALAGDAIDPNIDLTQFQTGLAGAQPLSPYKDGSMWFQGLNLGLNWTF